MHHGTFLITLHQRPQSVEGEACDLLTFSLWKSRELVWRQSFLSLPINVRSAQYYKSFTNAYILT